MIDDKLKNDMMILLGIIEAIDCTIADSSYYEMIELIKNRYLSILKRTVGYEDE